MSHMKFSEYVIAKKNKEKVKIEKIADYEGPHANKPEENKIPKNAGGNTKSPNKNKLPYMAPKTKINTEKGFAYSGDKENVYEPNTDLDNKSKRENGVAGGSKVASWPKTGMQEWIDKNKNLSLADYTKKIRNESLKNINPKQLDSLKETVEICKKNKNYVSNLVREMKRNGLFESLANEVASHEESINVFAGFIQNKPYAHKFIQTLSEMVSPPIGGPDDMNMPKPKPKPKPKHQNMGDDDMGDDDMGDDDMGDDDMDNDDMDNDDMGDDDMSDDDMSDDDMSDDDMSDDDMGDDDMDDDHGDTDDNNMHRHGNMDDDIALHAHKKSSMPPRMKPKMPPKMRPDMNQF